MAYNSLAGILAAQQSEGMDLQRAQGVMSLADMLRQRKDENEFKALMESGAAPEQVMQGLLARGPKGATAAHSYAGAIKDMETSKAMQGMRGLTPEQLQDPDTMRKLGASGIPGTAHFGALADKAEKKKQNDALLASMRRQPGAEGSEGGLFGDLIASEHPAIRNQAMTFQSQLEVPNQGIQAQHFLDMQARLAAAQKDINEKRRAETEKKTTPLSDVAKVEADYKAGRISKETYEAVIGKKMGKVESNLTPDALDHAADRYYQDGSLPPNLGRGTQGAMNTALILNKAAEKAVAAGDTGEGARIRQSSNKATVSALTQLSKQEAQVGAFEKNFIKNADLALEQSARVDRTGSPAIDRWINAGKKNIAGDPEVAKLDVAMKTVVNEYAKILSGSMGNTVTAEGEIKKVENLLSSASSPAQVREVIGFMKRETANRMKGFTEQKKELTDSMRSTPAAQTSTPAKQRIRLDAQGNIVQ